MMHFKRRFLNLYSVKLIICVIHNKLSLELATFMDFLGIIYAIIEFIVYYFGEYGLFPQQLKMMKAIIVIRLIRCFRLSALNKGSEVN